MRSASQRAGRQMATRAATFILSAVLLVACAIPAVAARISWHRNWEQALQAAAESGKPILAFVYLSASNRPGNENTLEPSRRMLSQTLVDPAVVEAAKAFEPILIDVRDPDTASLRRKLKIGPVSAQLDALSPQAEEYVAAYPITLFLDSHGDELFRRRGYLPAVAYAIQLERAATLFEKMRAVTEDPNDPVARRELGRAYMEMDFAPDDPFYRAAVRNLEAAIEMDPDDVTGANFDARVDLAILRLPEDPEAAVAKLFELQSEDEDGDRRLEIQYYMAVAYYVMEDLPAATQLLEQFETGDENSPYFDSEWTPQALGLLKHIRQRMDAAETTTAR